MTSPQLENGYIRIATELFEQLHKIRIPGEAMQILLFIIRKTYGWQKKSDYISLSQFANATGISKRNVIRGLNKLKEMKLINSVKKDTLSTPKYSINKSYGEWEHGVKKDTCVKKCSKKVSKKTHTIDTTKDKKIYSRVEKIINYLNEKANTRFSPKTQSTIKHISGRINDGYSDEDFFYVIDVKTADWKNDGKMSKFLRPSTLFIPSNFESYLNEKPSVEELSPLQREVIRLGGGHAK